MVTGKWEATSEPCLPHVLLYGFNNVRATNIVFESSQTVSEGVVGCRQSREGREIILQQRNTMTCSDAIALLLRDCARLDHIRDTDHNCDIRSDLC